MGTYSQWTKSRNLGRVIWVHGPELALVQEVVQFVRNSVQASSMDRFTYEASANTDTEIWDSVYSRSLTDGAPRLVEVSGAEKLKSVDRLNEWISSYSKYSPETTLLLVSTEEPTSSTVKAPKATVVKCVMHKPEDKLTWVMRAGSFSDSTARRLLEYKNGNLEESYGICQKVKALLPDQEGIELSLETLQSLDEETPQGFVEALVERDKPGAFAAICSVSSDRVGGVLSQLDYTLTLIDKLRDVFAETPRGQKLDSVPGFPMGRFSDIAPAARIYTFQDLVRCRQIVTLLESYHRQGVSDGLLEALVSLW